LRLVTETERGKGGRVVSGNLVYILVVVILVIVAILLLQNLL